MLFPSLFSVLFHKGTLAKGDDENEIENDEFAEEDFSPNDVKQKQGQNDPWGRRRRRWFRRSIGIAARLAGKKRDNQTPYQQGSKTCLFFVLISDFYKIKIKERYFFIFIYRFVN